MRRDAALVRELAGVGRLDAEDAVPAAWKLLEQRAVVRPDVDDQIVGRADRAAATSRVQLGEVLAQDPGRAAGVRVARREEDARVHDQAELDERAAPAAQHLRPDTPAARAAARRSAASGSPAADSRGRAPDPDPSTVADLAAIDDDARHRSRRGQRLHTIPPSDWYVRFWLAEPAIAYQATAFAQARRRARRGRVAERRELADVRAAAPRAAPLELARHHLDLAARGSADPLRQST